MSFTTHTFTSLALVSLTSIAFSTQAIAVEGSWQVGVNAGLSRLSPDTGGSGFTLDDDQSAAAGFYFGFDLMPIISAELAFTSLGEASLSDNESIEYQAISLGATAYLWGEKEADRRSNGASVYARLGVSAIDNESDIALDESDNIALWLGLGVQYPFSESWGLRAEITSFDGDAQTVMAGVFWRTGTSSRDETAALANNGLQPNRPEEPDASAPTQPAEPVIPEPTQPAEPVESETPTIAERVAPEPTLPAEPATPEPTLPAEPVVSETPRIAERFGREPTLPVEPVTPEPTQPEEPLVSEPVVDQDTPQQVQPAPPTPITPSAEVATAGVPVCPPAAAAKVRDPQACAVLSGVVPDLDFVVDTAKLTASATTSLDRIVTALQDNPAVVLEIRAHVQSLARPEGQAQLSSLRARAVARYLVENGVPVSRLRAKAFGATQPIADTATPAGVRTNNRIELRIL